MFLLMNIKQSIAGMFVALTVSTVGATIPSYLEDNIVDIPDTIQPSYVTKAEFDTLKSEVLVLKESYKELEENSSDRGFGSILWSLIFGVVGGAAMFFVANKYFIGRQQKTIADVVDVSSQKETKAEISHEPSHPQKNESRRKKETLEQVRTTATSKNVSATDKQQKDQIQEWKLQNTASDRDRKEEIVKSSINASPKPQDIKKRLYANIMIPSKGMLIVPDYAFSDAETDENFQFDLNETKGTGTYTIAPSVLRDGISRLSVLEKYVEPFEFDSTAKQINVERCGTVVHVEGENYWKVESKMIISLS